MVHSAAGNTIRDGESKTFTYDGENKQVVVKNSSNVKVGEYWYDGDGKRVKKWAFNPSNNETEITIFVYDTAGKQIAEYSTNVAAIEQAEVAYLTNDHLGSPRINTDRDGNVTSRHDYHPFGEEILTPERGAHPEYTPDVVRKKFTGYERDLETKTDHAKARYFTSSLGRFASVDPVLISLFSYPQSWNKYVYALNSPLSMKDPSGKWPTDIHDMLIREAFPGLTDYQINRIQMGSYMVDMPGNILDSNAHKHAQSNSEYGPADAEMKMNNFIEENLNAARESNGSSENQGARSLVKFGMAMHPVMDNTSPKHEGFQRYTGPLSNKYASSPVLAIGLWIVESLEHAGGESVISYERKWNTIGQMRTRYEKTYGTDAYNKAIRPRANQRWYGGLLSNQTYFNERNLTCPKGKNKCELVTVREGPDLPN